MITRLVWPIARAEERWLPWFEWRRRYQAFTMHYRDRGRGHSPYAEA